jgi:hypothetical protein
MVRYNKATGEEFVSTEQAAKVAGIAYITLRRWLGKGEFQSWLAKEGKRPLRFVELSSGKRIWQFGNQDRAALIAYRDDPDRNQRGATGRPRAEVKRERHAAKYIKRLYGLKVSLEEQKRNSAFRRYVKALVELRNQGFAPQDASLTKVPKKHISESAVMEYVTRAYYAGGIASLSYADADDSAKGDK